MKTDFINGNMAAALAAKHARVQVVAAYPITPQTHTVEYLAEFVANGELAARMIKVESEHSALSACAGASSVGARCFTASCSQGIALMTEVLYFTAGMRFPVVMAVANRTLSVPVNIWSDHQDTLVNRDSGWLQLYAGSVQEVYDLVLSAYRVAEDDRVCLPCIVSYEGFILSHACEPVKLLEEDEADRFLPPRESARPLLDPDKPLQFGEVLFPDWYPDYEYKKHRALADSAGVLRETFGALAELTGRKLDLTDAWYCEDAEVILLGIGSMMQTALHTARELRKKGQKVGVLNVRSYRPFPDEQVVAAVKNARVVAVLDRDIGYGTSGMVFQDVTRALYPLDRRPQALNFVVGTGGKDIAPALIERCVGLARDAKPGQSVLWPDARGPEEGIPYTEGLTL